MTPGKKVEAWGTYQLKTSRFSINLKNVNNGWYVLHVDFRPALQLTVMSSRLSKGWGAEIRCALPDFRAGERFKITLECRSSEFGIYFNDQELSETFPYRADLSSANIVSLEGGESGRLLWDEVSLPDQTPPQGIRI